MTPTRCPPPYIVEQPKQFPQDTTLSTTKDGKDIVIYMNSKFLKRVVDGSRQYPPNGPLLGRDFRRPTDFFAWLGPGNHRIHVQNMNVGCATDLIAVGSSYGRWIEHGILEI